MRRTTFFSFHGDQDQYMHQEFRATALSACSRDEKVGPWVVEIAIL